MYASTISSLLTLKPLLKCEMPEETIVKKEEGEKEEDKRKKMTKNRMRLYKKFSETKQLRKKPSMPLGEALWQVVLKRISTAALLKNHKSFIVKQPLPFVKQPGSSEKVFHLLQMCCSNGNWFLNNCVGKTKQRQPSVGLLEI